MDAAHKIHQKPVKGTLWGWVKENCGKRYRFVQKKGATKWLGKRIPGVGIVVGLVTVPGEIEAKGVGGGLLNAGIDAVPIVGTCKGIVEIIIVEDIISDK
jgi:hypothetical protein